ncbi:MAG: D-alanine--(R)-lactate ligase [Peptococcaceae bacterium]|jgi:D-alanine--(R)-lactate ligase|nr:D-alanine--(R)-lactate ligase [Peptococcaceae bacterium]
MGGLRIAVLFGGRSEEHDVSVKSAREIARHIDTGKYEPVYIGITRAGVWRMCETPRPGWESDNCCPAVISPDQKTGGLLSARGGECQISHIDAVFPVLHGKTGEDGAIQGLLELSGLPYVGCDIPSSALCMDKSLAYLVVRNAGIATPEFWAFDGGEPPEVDGAAYPVFVKPARSGSSFGVTKVERVAELAAAVESARRYDGKVVIERAVPGSEVGCAVLGNGSELTVGEVDQISLARGFFRIHQESEPEKGSENAVITVPASLPAAKREEIQETAKAIYRALGCGGLARVDMFLREDGRVVLNEVNTLPGFTSYSRYPRMMAAAGIRLPELIDRLITLALNGKMKG